VKGYGFQITTSRDKKTSDFATHGEMRFLFQLRTTDTFVLKKLSHFRM